MQSDGKLVIAGKTFNGTDDDFLVVRFVESGELDPSFGAGGLVIVDIGGFDDEGNAVRQQPDGKLVVAGYSSNGADEDFAVLRLDLDGGLDDTFGVGGVAVTPLGEGADIAFGAALQSDGAIVLGGISFDGTQNQLAAAFRGERRSRLDLRWRRPVDRDHRRHGRRVHLRRGRRHWQAPPWGDDLQWSGP
ncbi:MAG: hypothetical protein IPG04_40330 [Polyangiaceae bacterium]|nr:hypothetical protein [Polyangiaceae bacterium]